MIDGQTCALEAWGPKRDELEYSDAADGSGRMLYYITSKDKLMNRKLVLVYGARYRKIDNTRPLYNIAINMTLEPQSNSGLKSVKLSCVRQAGNQADDSFDLLPNGIQNLDVVFSVKKSLLGGDGTKTRCTSITAITEDGDAYETTVDLELNRSHRQNISKNLTLRPVGGGEIAISLENIDQLLKGTFASECLGLEENKSRYHFHFEEIPDSINKIKMSWWVLNYEDSSNCQNKTGRTTKGSVYDYNLTLQRDISQYGFIFQADFIPAPSNPSVYMLIKLDSNSDDIKTHILKGRSLSASGDSREFIAPMITPNISQFETQGPALQILTKSPEQ